MVINVKLSWSRNVTYKAIRVSFLLNIVKTRYV
jgi:hypothetical protein